MHFNLKPYLSAFQITTNAELLTNRGVINQFMGYLNCAMQDYQQAIAKDPKYALAYFNAANVYFLNKQFSQVCIWFCAGMVVCVFFKFPLGKLFKNDNYKLLIFVFIKY